MSIAKHTARKLLEISVPGDLIRDVRAGVGVCERIGERLAGFVLIEQAAHRLEEVDARVPELHLLGEVETWCDGTAACRRFSQVATIDVEGRHGDVGDEPE